MQPSAARAGWGLEKEEHSIFVVAPGPLLHMGIEHSTSPLLLLPPDRATSIRDEVRTTGLHAENIGQETIPLPFLSPKERNPEKWGPRHHLLFVVLHLLPAGKAWQQQPDSHRCHFPTISSDSSSRRQ